MAKNILFQTVIDALLDDSTPFSARYLHSFSDIAPNDLEALLKAWPEIAATRKHTLLDDLEDLSETDTLTSFDDLARALLVDDDPQIRISAIHLLWESEDIRLASILLKMLEKDDSPDVRAAAANALGTFVYRGELEEIAAETHHRIEEALIKAAKSAKEPLVRRRAIESLGYSSREEVIPLIESAYANQDPDWVASALFAMGRSSDERWKSQVLAKLRSPDEDIRSEAIQAAGELELASARPVLLDMLEDEEDLERRRAIIWALSKIGGEGVRERLDELLDAEDDDEEADFIEDALANLSFTEDMGQFDLFGLNPNQAFHTDDGDGDNADDEVVE